MSVMFEAFKKKLKQKRLVTYINSSQLCAQTDIKKEEDEKKEKKPSLYHYWLWTLVWVINVEKPFGCLD